MTLQESVGGEGEVRKRLLFIMLLRIVLITVLMGATLALNTRGSAESLESPSTRFLLALVAGTYALSIVWAIWFRAGRRIDILARLQLTVDLLFWGGLTYATGGVASGFSALFDLWVIVWAVVLGGRGAFHAAGMATVILGVLGLLMQTGILTPLSDQPQATLPLRAFAYSLGINVCALFIVAGLVNSLVRKLESAGLGLQMERTRRADLNQLYTDVVRSLTVGLATTRISGEVLTMNPAGLDMLGRALLEIEGAPLRNWFPEISQVLKVTGMRRSRGRGAVVGRDGDRIPVEYIVAPLSSATGEVQGFIVVFSDLREVRRLESALEKARRLSALGELAASLAHEIRNPLGALSGAFQILASSPGLTEEDSSLVDIIKREIERMERLVTDVLEYSRPRKREMESVDLATIARETVQAFRWDEEAAEREITVSAPDTLVQRADAGQIKQLLWNLLRNALQATEPGGQIAVSLHRTGDDVALLEVADTGYGIDSDVFEHIFDPFFSTRERGLGLGLALCRRIVDEHGGRIEANVREGGGTLFRIKLPKR